MASQAVGENQACCEVNSFIRGLHIYQDVWTPVTSEAREPENVRGCHTAGNRPEGEPGARTGGANRGAGYRLYGRQRYVDRAKEAILKLLNECLLYSFPHYAVTNCITKPI